MKFIKLLILPAILAVYMLFFMATSRPYKCDADCETIVRLHDRLRIGRDSLQLSVARCSYNLVSDTICVHVNGAYNWNWQGLADTACLQATDLGLRQQKIFILSYSNTGGYDTLAVRSCP